MTTRCCVLPRLGTSEATPRLPHTPSWRVQGQLYHYAEFYVLCVGQVVCVVTAVLSVVTFIAVYLLLTGSSFASVLKFVSTSCPAVFCCYEFLLPSPSSHVIRRKDVQRCELWVA